MLIGGHRQTLQCSVLEVCDVDCHGNIALSSADRISPSVHFMRFHIYAGNRAGVLVIRLQYLLVIDI